MSIPIDPSKPLVSTLPSSPSLIKDVELASSIPSVPSYLFPSIPSWRSSGLILRTLNPFRSRKSPEGTVSFVNGVWIIYLSVFLFWAINAANLYALVELGLSDGGN